jgi:hypothetical protein
MRDHSTHDTHQHAHGSGCGHAAVEHDGHTDYLHDGHMHHMHGDHVDEHNLSVSSQNPAACDSGHQCGSHDGSHQHGTQCGHERVPHGDHVDYLVEGHLHSRHGDHCDDHGRLVSA